jgi:hypothetical protein
MSKFQARYRSWANFEARLTFRRNPPSQWGFAAVCLTGARAAVADISAAGFRRDHNF